MDFTDSEEEEEERDTAWTIIYYDAGDPREQAALWRVPAGQRVHFFRVLVPRQALVAWTAVYEAARGRPRAPLWLRSEDAHLVCRAYARCPPRGGDGHGHGRGRGRGVNGWNWGGSGCGYGEGDERYGGEGREDEIAVEMPRERGIGAETNPNVALGFAMLAPPSPRSSTAMSMSMSVSMSGLGQAAAAAAASSNSGNTNATLSSSHNPNENEDEDDDDDDVEIHTQQPGIWQPLPPVRANWDGMFAEADGHFVFYGRRSITNLRPDTIYCHDFDFFEGGPGRASFRVRNRTYSFLMETMESTDLGV